jgi:zinc transport system substrate-binding protein
MKNKFFNIISILFITIILFGCTAKSQKPIYVTTCEPISLILKEIVKSKGNVITLLPAGASPHTYSPVPSDIQRAGMSKALFYVSSNLDGWAANIQCNSKIELIKILPQAYSLSFNDDMHSHSDSNTKDSNKIKENKKHNEFSNIDPHFWTDPLTVKALLPALVDTLSKIDPQNAGYYKINANLFSKKLDLIDRQVQDLVKNLAGKPIITYHQSFRYFLKRYNLKYAGSIEDAPGKEPTAKYISTLIKKIQDNKIKAIFNEPQLPSSFLNSLAEQAKVNIFTLDPIGGKNNIKTYSDLILYNAQTFKKALE